MNALEIVPTLKVLASIAVSIVGRLLSISSEKVDELYSVL